MCGAWYGSQAFSTRIQYSIISVGVKRDIEGVECVVGVKTQEECPLISLID
jgi:hypothetical protein